LRSIPDLDAFQLHLTPMNTTPPSLCMERPSGAAPASLAKDAAAWVMEGFDATIVAHGQSGTGKSHALFGGGGGAYETTDAGGGVLSGCVGEMFRRATATRAKRRDVAFTFGMSSWEMTPSGETRDLLEMTPSGEGGSENNRKPTTVRVTCAEEAEAAVAVRLLPIRPRSRGARRSLRTFPVVTLHPRFPFNV